MGLRLFPAFMEMSYYWTPAESFGTEIRDGVVTHATAGKTDLLVTWLYKLTIDNQFYNVGAVVGIMTFITLSIVSLLTFRHSGSYKNEEGFR